MKATVTISIEVSDLGDLEYVERVLEAGLGSATQPKVVKVDPVPPDVPAEEPAAEEPPKKTRKKRTSKKKAAPPPEPKPEPDADAASIDDVKDAVRVCVEEHGIDKARETFSQFGAEKLSDVAEADYSKLVEALRS
jgi:outer membrane biosynthesis protein TonB